jgi:hypothetical protein
LSIAMNCAAAKVKTYTIQPPQRVLNDYRGPGFLAVARFGSSLPLSRLHFVSFSLSPVEQTGGKGGKGRRRSQIKRRRESRHSIVPSASPSKKLLQGLAKFCPRQFSKSFKFISGYIPSCDATHRLFTNQILTA